MSQKAHEVATDDDLVGARNGTTPGLLDSPQAIPSSQIFLHAVHLRKVGRVARFWAAKGPLAPRTEGQWPLFRRCGPGDQMACFVQVSRSLSLGVAVDCCGCVNDACVGNFVLVYVRTNQRLRNGFSTGGL